jgi:hypothetical protein
MYTGPVAGGSASPNKGAILISRRDFGRLTALGSTAALFSRPTFGQISSGSAGLSLGSTTLAQMPLDFTGLSYEIVQLYNPDFFSASNTKLVQDFKNLSPRGVLRLGGNLSDVSRWNGPAGDFSTPKQAAAIEKGQSFWEWKLTDETVRANRDGAITPLAIRKLRSFLDSTGWSLIYGLNFGSGTPERAADEAAAVSKEIGPRLLSLQIGNEVDFFGGNSLFREKPYGFAQYYPDFLRFADAIRQRVPDARISGPDTANNLSWVEQFALAQPAKPMNLKAPLLSSHYYAMGPASNPAMNAERLLQGNPRLLTQISAASQAIKDSGGIPFRMTEGNSCFGGGKPGVSDSFCSALWVADYMLQVASAGYAGVNLHGGGDGFYTPIESLVSTAPSIRPIYLGMQLAQKFAGLGFVSSVVSSSANLTAYSAKGPRLLRVALINKSDQRLTVLPGTGMPSSKPAQTYSLSAPLLASTTDSRFVAVPAAAGKEISLQPYSAKLLDWSI